MRIHTLALFALMLFCAGFVTKPSHAQMTNTLNPVIVAELFTSRYCPSCPAADKLLAEMAKDKRVIPLSFHVDYWDRRGSGKNSLSRPFATHRQKLYQDFIDAKRIYTPQLIANGNAKTACVGSLTDDVNALMNSSKPIQQILITRRTDKALQLSLPNMLPDRYTIWLAEVKNDASSPDNRFHYTNAVMNFNQAGIWGGQAQEQNIVVQPNTDIDRYVVLIQSREFGEIVAAGQI